MTELGPKARLVLKLLEGTNGGVVSMDLLLWHGWERRKHRSPAQIAHIIKDIRTITGRRIDPVRLTIEGRQKIGGYRLVAVSNEVREAA